MKKQITILSAAFMALAMASCSSELAVNEAQPTTDIMISVKADAPIAGRAISTVDGYTLTCVMQLLNDDGSKVGNNATSEITAGGAQFTIKAADIDAGASKAIFFAHYVPTAGGSQVYDVTDLTNITYKTTELDITDGKLVSAADAFAGSLTTLTNGASVTLTRPFIQLNLTPYNPEAAEGATTLTVKYNAYQGYNVLTQAIITSDSKELTFTNTTFDTGASKWFTSYIFAPSNQSKFDQPITMTLGGGKSMNLNINPGDLIPLDANYIVNAGFTINAEEPEQDIEIDVTIDGDFVNEPKPAVFEVGAYVDAAGNPTNEKEQAVGVIFHVGAMVTNYGTDADTQYDATYSGKTIKGYAVAIKNTDGVTTWAEPGTYFSEGNTKTAYTGQQSSKALMENSDFNQTDVATNYSSFIAANALSSVGTTTTDWYIPTIHQLQWWITSAVSASNINGAIGEADASYHSEPVKVLADIFDKDNIYFNTTSYPVTRFISSTANDNKALSIIELAKFDSQMIRVKALGANQGNFVARPMFTIFEDAE